MTVPVSDLQAIAPSAVIELFVLELNTLQHGVTTTYYFHAGSSLNSNGELVWAGNNYLRFPIEADGFEYSGNGQLPRPKIRVSNILNTITALLLSLPNGLEGAKVTRIRTLARYLDAVNFPGSVNPYGTPDSTAEFPREIYYIDRKSTETRDVVEFELAAAFDLAGVRAPKRQCIANICQWKYRSAECGYTGPPVADPSDSSTGALSSSAESIAYYSSEATLNAATTNLNNARASLTAAQNNLNAAQSTYVLAEDRYANPIGGPLYFVRAVRTYGNNATPIDTVDRVKWNNNNVTLGAIYRQGSYVTGGQVSGITYRYYRIQRWEISAAAVSSAQSAYNAALSTYNSVLSSYNSALSTRNSALAAWQAALNTFLQDVAISGDSCGKRLTSCELRFGQNAELPFGSFPGIGTYFA